MSHQHVGRLTPWTFGYTPGTKSDCTGCGKALVWVVGPKRMYWKLNPAGMKACDRCGRRWAYEHHCKGEAA